MDGRTPCGERISGLNKEVGFSSFPCCDCFASKDGVISLIEATQALDTFEQIKKKYSYIPLDKFTPERDFSDEEVRKIKKNLFRDYMAQRSLRKVLGSMAMLSRVALRCDNPALHTDDALPKYNFWLVIHLSSSEKYGSTDARALDNLEALIRDVLTRALDVSKSILGDVDVVVGGRLARKMHQLGFPNVCVTE